MNPSSALTDRQKLILDSLSAEKEPISAYALLDKLRSQGFRAPAQVYRVLERLISQGLVHKLESLNAFVACAHPHAPHKHGLIAFAICDTCGQASEFADAAIEKRLRGWADGHAFKAGMSLLEMHGTCEQCQPA